MFSMWIWNKSDTQQFEIEHLFRKSDRISVCPDGNLPLAGTAPVGIANGCLILALVQKVTWLEFIPAKKLSKKYRENLTNNLEYLKEF